jgi:ankyrin repeat protein
MKINLPTSWFLMITTLLFTGCQDSYQAYHRQTPLMVAVRHSQSIKVSSLLFSRENVNAIDQEGHTALTYAASSGDIKIMRLLLMAGADIHYENERPLVDCVLGGHQAGAKYLISKGADLNARQSEGYSILMRAVKGGDIEMAKLLVESGADVNAKSDYGDTVVSYARAKGYSQLAEFLKSQGAQE